jgi:hypothetical protein
MLTRLTTLLPIALILWLACLLRWYDPGLIPYTYDDASQIALAGSIGGNPFTGEGHFPLLSGGTTLGVERSALHAYVLAGSLALGGEIEAAVLALGGLGVLAVALGYRLGYRVGGRFVGYGSALFLAANPWLVYHDRRLWAHISTLLATLLLYLAWRVVVDRQTRHALWAAQIVALQTLIHTLGVVQALSLLGALIAAPRAWLRPRLFYGAALALLLLAPYGWALVQAQPDLLAGNSPDRQAQTAPTLAPRLSNLTRTNHWTLLSHLATGSGFSSIIARQETERLWWRAGRQAAAPIMWVLLVLGGLRVIARLWQPAHAPGARLLLLWGALPMLLLGVQPVRIAFQYWTVLLPLPALAAALGLDWLRVGLMRLSARKISPRRAAIFSGALALSVALIVTLIWNGSFATVQMLRQTGEAGTPLRAWRVGVRVAEQAAAQAQTEEIRFAVSGLDPAFDGEAATVAALIGNPPYARFVAPEGGATGASSILLNYTQPSLYYWTLDAPAAEEILAAWGERIWQGNPRAGEPAARLYRLPPYTALDLVAIAMEGVTPGRGPIFDVGLELLAVDFPPTIQAGQPAHFRLIWRVLEPPWEARARDFTAFNHILDESGQMAAQIDGLALLSRDWWPGDVLIQSYALSLPAGELVWRTGLYSRVDGGRAYTEDWTDAVDIPFQVLP